MQKTLNELFGQASVRRHEQVPLLLTGIQEGSRESTEEQLVLGGIFLSLPCVRSKLSSPHLTPGWCDPLPCPFSRGRHSCLLVCVWDRASLRGWPRWLAFLCRYFYPEAALGSVWAQIVGGEHRYLGGYPSTHSLVPGFLLCKMKEGKVKVKSCPTLCDPMDCSLPGISVHGIFQARILEWVAISFSRRSSWPRDWTWVSLLVSRRFTLWATREVLQNGNDLNSHPRHAEKRSEQGPWSCFLDSDPSSSVIAGNVTLAAYSTFEPCFLRCADCSAEWRWELDPAPWGVEEPEGLDSPPSPKVCLNQVADCIEKSNFIARDINCEKGPSPWGRLTLLKDASLSGWHFPLWAQTWYTPFISSHLRGLQREHLSSLGSPCLRRRD